MYLHVCIPPSPPTHTYTPIFYLFKKQVGTMQAQGYIARYIGNVLGATLGTVLYNKVK